MNIPSASQPANVGKTTIRSAESIFEEDGDFFVLDKFPEEENPDGEKDLDRIWKVLIVDDEESVHHVTELVLHHFEFSGRKLQLLHAASGQEAQSVLKENPDIALVLLDVIMETDHAGLDVVNYTRDVLNNEKVRILMRTGQPGGGVFTENQLIRKFEFNDYRNKAELSSSELKSAVTGLLRAYDELCSEWASLPGWVSDLEPNVWKILVVDDEIDVLKLTGVFLEHFEFENKKIEIYNAESVIAAQKILKEHPDMNLMIVDLALAEGELAGLTLADTIRTEFGNYVVQILVRTGRGSSDKPNVLREHEINDYRQKTELPSIRFDTVICSLLRTYRDIINIHKKQQNLLEKKIG